jgi:hypothetical protein
VMSFYCRWDLSGFGSASTTNDVADGVNTGHPTTISHRCVSVFLWYYWFAVRPINSNFNTHASAKCRVGFVMRTIVIN